MDMTKLEALQREAMKHKKYIYCWKPSMLTSNPDELWIIDNSGKREEYQISSIHSFKAIITPYGNAIIYNPDNTVTHLDAPILEPIPEVSQESFELIINGDKRKNPEKGLFRSMSMDEIKALSYGDHPYVKLNNGHAGHVKVNGKVRTWKRDAERIEVPCKYGMYECYTFTRHDIDRLLVRLDKE